MGTTMTSTIIITDRLEGVWERSIVAGVSSFEILLTHFATQMIIVAIQVIEVIILTFAVYKMEYVGSIALICCFIALEGLCGMCFGIFKISGSISSNVIFMMGFISGFWISVISENHNMANIVATGSFYPMIVLCGKLFKDIQKFYY